MSGLKSGIKKRCFILHGFNVWDDGKNTTDKFVGLVRELGYDPIPFDYGWIGFIGARFFSRNLAKLLASLTSHGDIAIGHSNGCNIINQAVRYGAQFERLLYVSPALDESTDLGAQVLKCTVLHTHKDWVVRLSRWIPHHPWGRMGAVGYRGMDSRYHNVDCTNWSFGHSDYFREENVQRLFYHARRALDENENCDFNVLNGIKRVCEFGR